MITSTQVDNDDIARNQEDEDLDFLKTIKKEKMTSSGSSKDLLDFKRRRRNSSFADFFEGDLSQNLLSRRHFLGRDSECFSDEKVIFDILSDREVQDCGYRLENLKVKDSKQKNMSKVLLASHWFFRKPNR